MGANRKPLRTLGVDQVILLCLIIDDLLTEPDFKRCFSTCRSLLEHYEKFSVGVCPWPSAKWVPLLFPRLPQRLNALSPLLNLNVKQLSQEQFFRGLSIVVGSNKKRTLSWFNRSPGYSKLANTSL